MKNVFVTGATGYIGSHTCVELLESGYNVIGLDNFSNSKKEVLDSIYEISKKNIVFYEGDMSDYKLLDKIFNENRIDVVIDFAAYKSVGDSVSNPVAYYQNNVASVLVLLEVMEKHNVKSLVFSSSATVYGVPKQLPILESDEIGGTTNPYGTSKLCVEKILSDLYIADDSYNLCIFRYFNPVGSHESGLIGEDPVGKPANLMPFICKVAIGELPCLEVFGNDYDTIDGTGVRDYIHVVDLAKAHVKGVEKLINSGKGHFVYNLGTGTGYSVLDMINTFKKVNNIDVFYKISNRRPGDIASCYANSDKALSDLSWKAEKTLEDMCKDALRYYKK